MRITSGMMIANSLSNINDNKLRWNNLNTQMETMQKIQRPSEDPIIAVRALRLRTTYSQIEQYLSRNIADAKNWMSYTNLAITQIENTLGDITTYLEQGANGYLEETDKATIVQTLSTYRDQIFSTANSDYASRTIFTGYKTDSVLAYNKDEPDLKYEINESFNFDDIRKEKKIINGIDISQVKMGTIADLDVSAMDVPEYEDAYIMRLGYDEIDTPAADAELNLYKKDADGNVVLDSTITAVTKTLSDADAYKPGDDEVYFIPEKGEYVFGKNVYAQLEECERVDVTYTKTGFEEGDLNPVHYFNCTDISDENNPIVYTLKDQPIQYEVSFNHNMTINIQGKDVFQHDMTRDIDEIIDTVNDAIACQNNVDKIKELCDSYEEGTDEREKLNELLTMAEREMDYATDRMNKMFAAGLTKYHEHQSTVSLANADIGARQQRLELTESRLSDQKLTVKNLKDNNEKIDEIQVTIELKQASSVYDASLATASKIIQKKLIDFL